MCPNPLSKIGIGMWRRGCHKTKRNKTPWWFTSHKVPKVVQQEIITRYIYRMLYISANPTHLG